MSSRSIYVNTKGKISGFFLSFLRLPQNNTSMPTTTKTTKKKKKVFMSYFEQTRGTKQYFEVIVVFLVV